LPTWGNTLRLVGVSLLFCKQNRIRAFAQIVTSQRWNYIIVQAKFCRDILCHHLRKYEGNLYGPCKSCSAAQFGIDQLDKKSFISRSWKGHQYSQL
jgi:hypothetical protein